MDIYAHEPLIIEKRHDFYENRFTVALYNETSVFEGDRNVVVELTDIFKNILNAK